MIFFGQSEVVENENETPVKHFIAVEGNIGAGKSTLINKLKKEHKDVCFISEPHQRWQNVDGYNLLDEFYKDMNRWAYSFQNYAFLTRTEEIEKSFAENKDKSLFISERSVFSDFYTFAYICFSMGYINNLEWNMYIHWHNWLTENYVKKVDGFIYLRTQPSVSYDRIKQRSRSEECKVTKEYLKMLHDAHENWLIHKRDIKNNSLKYNAPVLVLDGDIDFATNDLEWNCFIERIKDFVYKVCTNGKHKDYDAISMYDDSFIYE
jgi:deoxyadenosine/deoxycytidine kinase